MPDYSANSKEPSEVLSYPSDYILDSVPATAVERSWPGSHISRHNSDSGAVIPADPGADVEAHPGNAPPADGSRANAVRELSPHGSLPDFLPEYPIVALADPYSILNSTPGMLTYPCCNRDILTLDYIVQVMDRKIRRGPYSLNREELEDLVTRGIHQKRVEKLKAKRHKKIREAMDRLEQLLSNEVNRAWKEQDGIVEELGTLGIKDSTKRVPNIRSTLDADFY